MINPHLAAKPEATTASPVHGGHSAPTRAEIKRAAMDFEAIMLGQLTAALRPQTNEGDEEASLVGGQGDLVQQMFGEQLATALAKGGGIGLAELLMHEMDPNKDKAAAMSPLERAAETTRHLRRADAAPAAGSTIVSPSAPLAGSLSGSAIATTPSAASLMNPAANDVASPSVAQPKAIDPLLGVSRPRRVSELVSEVKAELSSPPLLAAVKLTVAPEAEAAKPVFADAVSSRPGVKELTRLDAATDELLRVTRPRRLSELLNAGPSGRTSAVKLPPAAAAETVNPSAAGEAVKSITGGAAARRTINNSPALNAQPVYTGQPRLDAIIEQAGRRHGIDPHLIAAVLHTESGKRQNAVSNKGAAGYMQLMPDTFKQFAGPGKNIFDAATNINTGAAYLKYLSNKYNGSIDKVLAGYNAGIGNVERFGGVPPFRETRNFVASVKKNYRELLAANPAAPSGLLATSDNGASAQRVSMKPKTTAAVDALNANLAAHSHGAARSQTLEKAAANNASASTVDLQLPVQGRISSTFGATRRHGSHKGVDIAAARGTPIEASADGEVVFAGWKQGYGKTVLIKHQEGTFTRYAHADKLMVERGDTVQMGQQVATVGTTGHSTGPHLHFEIMQGSRHINPMRAVSDNPIGHVTVRIEK